MPASYSLSNEVGAGLRSCSTTAGCFEALAVSMAALLLWAGFATGLLFAPRGHVRDAAAAIKRECVAVAAERRAFGRFADRLADVPAQQLSQSAQGSVLTASSPATGAGMAAVEEAYRETVMAVDHYEADYDEPFGEHLASEFGEQVASAVLTNDRLSPQVKSALLTGAREGCQQRTRYIEALNGERERIEQDGELFETVHEECEAVDGNRLRRRPFEDLQDRLERLDRQQQSLSERLQARQERLQKGISFGWQRRDAESLNRYLYADLDTIYPVLADGTELLQRLKDVESRLVTALTART